MEKEDHMPSDINDMYRFLNGLDIADPVKRAEHLMQTVIDGCVVGPGNREGIKDHIVRHFQNDADALAKLVSENERLRNDPCVVHPLSSRACSRGTPGCVADHSGHELTERKVTCEHDWNVRIVTPEPRTELYCDRCGEVKP